MIKADSTICDAWGRRYTFTNYKDRCPDCCPVDEPDVDESDDLDLSGEWYDDD